MELPFDGIQVRENIGMIKFQIIQYGVRGR